MKPNIWYYQIFQQSTMADRQNVFGRFRHPPEVEFKSRFQKLCPAKVIHTKIDILNGMTEPELVSPDEPKGQLITDLLELQTFVFEIDLISFMEIVKIVYFKNALAVNVAVKYRTVTFHKSII